MTELCQGTNGGNEEKRRDCDILWDYISSLSISFENKPILIGYLFGRKAK